MKIASLNVATLPVYRGELAASLVDAVAKSTRLDC